jgi:membrane glycosyltransferase
VVTGFVTALMGFWVTLKGDRHALSATQSAARAAGDRRAHRHHHADLQRDVPTVFAGLRATCESVAAPATCSSSTCSCCRTATTRPLWPPSAPPGKTCVPQLAGHPDQPQIEVYYRLRKRRTHRKAGNVADFCRRWGRDYRYMVVLDADSVMSGDCIVSWSS